MNQILTVLIPTYNSHKCFLKVVKSYQNDHRVRIIVSDDSDDIKEQNLIKSFCSKFKIHYSIGPKSSPAANWNKLLRNINTPFFVLNHHDDYPNNLNFLDELETENVGLKIMACSSKVKDKNIHVMKSWQQYLFSKICLLFPNASLNMLLAPTASLIVNSKLKNIFFDENLTWFVDADWYLKLFSSAKKLDFKVNFFNKSRIISVQDKNSVTWKLRSNLKEQIIKERSYLSSKGLYPGFIIDKIQFFILALILLNSKIKQLLS